MPNTAEYNRMHLGSGKTFQLKIMRSRLILAQYNPPLILYTVVIAKSILIVFLWERGASPFIDLQSIKVHPTNIFLFVLFTALVYVCIVFTLFFNKSKDLFLEGNQITKHESVRIKLLNLLQLGVSEIAFLYLLFCIDDSSLFVGDFVVNGNHLLEILALVIFGISIFGIKSLLHSGFDIYNDNQATLDIFSYNLDKAFETISLCLIAIRKGNFFYETLSIIIQILRLVQFLRLPNYFKICGLRNISYPSLVSISSYLASNFLNGHIDQKSYFLGVILVLAPLTSLYMRILNQIYSVTEIFNNKDLELLDQNLFLIKFWRFIRLLVASNKVNIDWKELSNEKLTIHSIIEKHLKDCAIVNCICKGSSNSPALLLQFDGDLLLLLTISLEVFKRKLKTNPKSFLLKVHYNYFISNYMNKLSISRKSMTSHYKNFQAFFLSYHQHLQTERFLSVGIYSFFDQQNLSIKKNSSIENLEWVRNASAILWTLTSLGEILDEYIDRKVNTIRYFAKMEIKLQALVQEVRRVFQLEKIFESKVDWLQNNASSSMPLLFKYQLFYRVRLQGDLGVLDALLYKLKKSKIHLRQMKKNELRNFQELQILEGNIAILHLEIADSDSEVIRYASNNCLGVISYNKSELEGSNLSTLLPGDIKSHHRYFMRMSNPYTEMSMHTIQRKVYFEDSDGFLCPCHLQVRLKFSITHSFVEALVSGDKDKPITMMLDQEGYITSISQKAFETFCIDRKGVADRTLNLNYMNAKFDEIMAVLNYDLMLTVRKEDFPLLLSKYDINNICLKKKIIEEASIKIKEGIYVDYRDPFRKVNAIGIIDMDKEYSSKEHASSEEPSISILPKKDNQNNFYEDETHIVQGMFMLSINSLTLPTFKIVRILEFDKLFKNYDEYLMIMEKRETRFNHDWTLDLYQLRALTSINNGYLIKIDTSKCSMKMKRREPTKSLQLPSSLIQGKEKYELGYYTMDLNYYADINKITEYRSQVQCHMDAYIAAVFGDMVNYYDIVDEYRRKKQRERYFMNQDKNKNIGIMNEIEYNENPSRNQQNQLFRQITKKDTRTKTSIIDDVSDDNEGTSQRSLTRQKQIRSSIISVLFTKLFRTEVKIVKLSHVISLIVMLPLLISVVVSTSILMLKFKNFEFRRELFEMQFATNSVMRSIMATGPLIQSLTLSNDAQDKFTIRNKVIHESLNLSKLITIFTMKILGTDPIIKNLFTYRLLIKEASILSLGINDSISLNDDDSIESIYMINSLALANIEHIRSLLKDRVEIDYNDADKYSRFLIEDLFEIYSNILTQIMEWTIYFEDTFSRVTFISSIISTSLIVISFSVLSIPSFLHLRTLKESFESSTQIETRIINKLARMLEISKNTLERLRTSHYRSLNQTLEKPLQNKSLIDFVPAITKNKRTEKNICKANNHTKGFSKYREMKRIEPYDFGLRRFLLILATAFGFSIFASSLPIFLHFGFNGSLQSKLNIRRESIFTQDSLMYIFPTLQNFLFEGLTKNLASNYSIDKISVLKDRLARFEKHAELLLESSKSSIETSDRTNLPYYWSKQLCTYKDDILTLSKEELLLKENCRKEFEGNFDNGWAFFITYLKVYSEIYISRIETGEFKDIRQIREYYAKEQLLKKIEILDKIVLKKSFEYDLYLQQIAEAGQKQLLDLLSIGYIVCGIIQGVFQIFIWKYIFGKMKNECELHRDFYRLIPASYLSKIKNLRLFFNLYNTRITKIIFDH